jgi:hypothetical protein
MGAKEHEDAVGAPFAGGRRLSDPDTHTLLTSWRVRHREAGVLTPRFHNLIFCDHFGRGIDQPGLGSCRRLAKACRKMTA